MKRLLPLLLAPSLLLAGETYTVKIGDPLNGGKELTQFTNVVQVIRNHDKAEPQCHLIRYVERGKTNEFHAWAVPITITTNKAK